MTSGQTNNKELFEKYRQTGNIELRNEIVEKYLYMVDILIKKYLNKGVDYDDLYQVGSMALVFAVERFDASKGYEFTSFATPTIIGEIKRYFRDKGWAVKVPRRLKEISAQISPAKEHLYGKLSRIPTVAELAEYLGYSEEEILEAMEGGQAYSTYSLNQTFDEGGEEGEGAVLEKYTGTEESGYNSFENAELIKSVLQVLSDKERDIFKRRYFKNQTQQDIADDMGVSQMTISRLEKRIREKFKDALRA
ncbi:SigB/SigF/SigG family RNA polymerase sigma factor [Sinanaerobacter chloroacetimidivorans]|jgi:RNA polymerase sigma-B factor|uniref:SigB/SigF/SigG family RNA polymerase sigma factor n=1 Tax=Sinanaerobacter chloroacetimidivorans TaxID=2818044 RepID=A0A8J7W110_9FIRM|nr:SigB/SigF/SigG family RNA polymerase sigma factor [Sinanaerobacter chloroacetimidivorans]MBR0598414.1 SigB/SigF/SigG family RNA polymerase sigma factor [Sinanaerobacter chloroacetimidivorans]